MLESLRGLEVQVNTENEVHPRHQLMTCCHYVNFNVNIITF